jgi:hypothetical protein
VGEWHDYAITVDGADLTAVLNGQVVNRFHFRGDSQSPQRGGRVIVTALHCAPANA